MTLDFRALKKLANRVPEGLPHGRLALAGDSSTQFLAQAIRGMGVTRGLELTVYEPGCDQLEQAFFDPDAALYRFEPEFVVVQFTAEALARAFQALPAGERATFAERQLQRFEALWAAIRQHARARILWFNLIELEDGVFGSYANKTPGSLLYQLRLLNLRLMEAASRANDVYIVDVAALAARLGRGALHDPRLYYAAAMPLGLDGLPAVAGRVLDVVEALRGMARKCLVLDLDNTLWGGVLAEDGLDGIQLGELGTGKVYTDLQTWALALKQRGVLLAVCSKNDEAVALEAFERHPDMVLTLADIAVFVANWETKVDNLRAIQARLNIGFDAMVFVDDNPFEREMVRAMLPEVRVPELPADPAAYRDFLAAQNLFEVATLSGEDAVRTQQYLEAGAREAHRASFASVDEYLASLEMVATVAPIGDFHVPRVAQLSQRTNQFNLRTRRYDEADVARLARMERYHTRVVALADRFGDHGWVGALVLEALDETTLFIDTWLMSCRVLKRGLEAFMLGEIMAIARTNGFARVVGEYLPTPKNGLVAELLEGFGFTREPDGRWSLAVSDFVPPTTFIRRAAEALPTARSPRGTP